MPQLTAKFVATAKPGKYHDRDGLMLHVRASGSRSWVWRGVISDPHGGRGRRVDRGIGNTRVVTLREARDIALEYRRVAHRGVDPGRRRAQAERPTAPTLAEAIEATIAVQRAAWKPGSRSEDHWRANLTRYALPTLGDRPIDTITSSDLLGVISPVWSTRREAGRKLVARLRAVIRWALAEGHIAADPLPPVEAALPRNGVRVEHHASIPPSEVGRAIRTVQASRAHWATKLAYELIALSGVRSAEARLATWSEFDLEAAVWCLPGERTKTGEPQRIPLAPRVLEILRDARERGGAAGLVFPAPSGRPLTSEALSKLARELGLGGSIHGLRASLRTWCAERGVDHATAEALLGHIQPGVVAAYQRGDLLAARRGVLERWGEHVAR